MDPFFDILLSHSENSKSIYDKYLTHSTALESEIAKYIHSFVSSKLEILAPQYEMIKNRVLMLLSVDGLSDQIQSLLIKSYRRFVCLLML